MIRLLRNFLQALAKINMENTPEIKNALANFLGFAMSKSKELDSHIVPGSAVSKNTINTDYVISKAATEIEQKFGRPNNIQPVAPEAPMDIASMLIPIPDLDVKPASELQASSAPPASVQPTHQADTDMQLEFNFVEPNAQTKLILDEIKLLNSRVSNIIRLLEDKKPANKKK